MFNPNVSPVVTSYDPVARGAEAAMRAHAAATFDPVAFAKQSQLNQEAFAQSRDAELIAMAERGRALLAREVQA